MGRRLALRGREEERLRVWKGFVPIDAIGFSVFESSAFRAFGEMMSRVAAGGPKGIRTSLVLGTLNSTEG